MRNWMLCLLCWAILLKSSPATSTCPAPARPSAGVVAEAPEFFEVGIPFTIEITPPEEGWPTDASEVRWIVPWQAGSIHGSLRQEFVVPSVSTAEIRISATARGPNDTDGCLTWFSVPAFIFITLRDATPTPTPLPSETPTPTPPPPTPCPTVDIGANMIYPRPQATDLPTSLTMIFKAPTRLALLEAIEIPGATPVPFTYRPPDRFEVMGLRPSTRYYMTIFGYTNCFGQDIYAWTSVYTGNGLTPTPSPTPTPVPQDVWMMTERRARDGDKPLTIVPLDNSTRRVRE